MTFSAPARIDLAGGTLDVPPLCFMLENSLTLNLAIDYRAEVSIEPSEQYGLIWDGGALQDPMAEALFAKAIAYFQPQTPVLIRAKSDVPRASGLGGSSTLLTALVAAFSQLIDGKNCDPETLLNRVTLLEHRILGKPAGTQDAIAAIYGGLSMIDYREGVPRRKALALPDFLSGPLLLAYDDEQHHSGINNWAIIKAACEGEAETLRVLWELGRNADTMRDAIERSDSCEFLESLSREALLRRELAPGLYTNRMNLFAQHFEGRLVSKICGAGGGGCMLLFGATHEREEIMKVASRLSLQILEVKVENDGIKGVYS